MTKELKWIIAGIVFNLILTILVGIMVVASNPNGTFGITSMRVEDYIPVIRENAGYYSDEPIYTTDTLQADSAATLGSTLAVTGATTLIGTTTQRAPSNDGFVASRDVTMATGTAKASFTATGKMMCRGGGVYFDATAGTGLNPSIIFSLGTTTALLTYGTGLIASTTVATDTDKMVDVTMTATHFLAAGEKIQLGLSDYNGDSASSTYYSNWDVEFGIPCWLMGSNY